MRLTRRQCWFLGCLLTLAGCAPFYPNKPSHPARKKAEYRFDAFPATPTNTDDIFVCLAFSGGGTRAAALAYGTLLGLKDAQIQDSEPGVRKYLLDEVDMISAVSGGSFTAMAYGSFGADLFDSPFEHRFLRRNVQLDLLFNLVMPRNLLRIPFVLLDRSDVAAYYYDEEVFARTTFADLIERGRRPFIVINATDLARRQRFEFTQDDFDLLGSNLSDLSVGWATAASSAFPIILSPLRLKYFHGQSLNASVAGVLDAVTPYSNSRRQHWAESLLVSSRQRPKSPGSVSREDHQYFYLLDGGLSDNLGLAFFIESFRTGAIRRKLDAGAIKRLVIISVDAASEPPEDLERWPSSPSLLKVGERVGTTGMRNLSQALTGILKYSMLESHPRTLAAYRECASAMEKDCPGASVPKVPRSLQFEAYFIDLNFHRIQDARDRQNLFSILTRFVLPSRDVSALISAGRDLLTNHPEFMRLMEDLAGN